MKENTRTIAVRSVETEVVPPGPEQKSTYWVVAFGNTATLPLVGATDPTPEEMEQFVAFRHAHERVDEPGGGITMRSLEAVKEQEGGSGGEPGGGGGVVLTQSSDVVHWLEPAPLTDTQALLTHAR